jgi:hypothetical protein
MSDDRRIRVLNILAVSDQVDPRIHSSSLRARMPDVDIVLGCGDVPARYLEFLADALDRPVYFVLGNHHEELTRKGISGTRYEPMGCIDIGGQVRSDPASGLILAGFPGSPKYSRETEQQYSDREVFWMMLRMTPKLAWNRIRHGRWVDILISHAPPRHINDRDDIPHRGFRTLRAFLRWFKPAIHLHGHVHIYDRNEVVETPYVDSTVINVYPFRRLQLEVLPATRAELVTDRQADHG